MARNRLLARRNRQPRLHGRRWRIVSGPSALRHDRGQQADGQRARRLQVQAHFFSPAPASAALLKRNWPIRFSKTMADWGCLITSPAGRFLSSAPGAFPMRFRHLPVHGWVVGRCW